jgi:hypothetical protein
MLIPYNYITSIHQVQLIVISLNILTYHITSCHLTFLHWKIILKTILYIAYYSSNHPAHSAQLSHLPPLDASSPSNNQSHVTNLPSLHQVVPSHLLFQNANPIASLPSPPPFQPLAPLQLWSQLIEDSPSPSGASPPDPFRTRPLIYKRHQESCCPHHTPSWCPSNEDFCSPLSFIFASLMIPLPRRAMLPMVRIAPYRLPLSHRSAAVTACRVSAICAAVNGHSVHGRPVD